MIGNLLRDINMNSGQYFKLFSGLNFGFKIDICINVLKPNSINYN